MLEVVNDHSLTISNKMKLDIPDFSNIKHYTNKKKFRNRHPLLPQWALKLKRKLERKYSIWKTI